METKQKTLEAVQKSSPDLEGQSARIQQQIVKINQQRAQISVEYKDAVRVSLILCLLCVLATRKTTLSRASGIMRFFFPANYALFFGELCAKNPRIMRELGKLCNMAQYYGLTPLRH